MESVLNQILAELKALNNRVGNVENDLSALNNRVGNMENDLSALNNRVGNMENDLSALKKGQLHLETRIENEIVEKIRALFDAREAQSDKTNQILDKLTDIDDSITYALAKVARHEAKLFAQKK
ncbi:MAG: conserved oligomeric Golgi complex subunit 6 [Peptococcaceae bacterium]|nr:conserved oligomeric Golgi complex subunit 6 [Peptococcaceae bacterium]